MKAKVVQLVALLAGVLLIVWGATITFDLHNHAMQYLRVYPVDTMKTEQTDASKKCSLSEACPAESYPFHIWSGAANVVGPKICFNGKMVAGSVFDLHGQDPECCWGKGGVWFRDLRITPDCKNIMSHVLNNIGPGINIVQIDEERGVVENHAFLNMEKGDSDDILTFLKAIKPGSIVLVASFVDICPKLTEEMMVLFEKMGSSMIRTAKSHDNWVFAGKTEAKEKSIFEKLVPNDPQTNLYDDWPRVAEMGGCLLKSEPVDQPEDAGNEGKL